MDEAQIWRDGDGILPDPRRESGKFRKKRPAAGDEIFYSILQDEGQNVLETKSGRARGNNRRSRCIYVPAAFLQYLRTFRAPTI